MRGTTLRLAVDQNTAAGRTSTTDLTPNSVGVLILPLTTGNLPNVAVAEILFVKGDKLIAIVPVLGWWDQRKLLKTQEVAFTLVVSVLGPGVYAAIRPRIEAEAAVTIDV